MPGWPKAATTDAPQTPDATVVEELLTAIAVLIGHGTEPVEALLSPVCHTRRVRHFHPQASEDGLLPLQLLHFLGLRWRVEEGQAEPFRLLVRRPAL